MPTALLLITFLCSGEVLGQGTNSSSGPARGSALSAAAQKHGVVSTTSLPQTEPVSPYLIRPEQVIEHPAPIQPPQPEGIPLVRPIPLEDPAAVRPRTNALPSGPVRNAPGLTQNFQGISATGWIPPDPIIAVGPNHIVVATNSSYAIYTKSGLRQFTTTFATFFASFNPPSSIFDPKVVYDGNAGRWIILLVAKDTTNSRAYYLIAVSENSDPNGRWGLWSVDAGLDGTTASGLWADFPGLGYDSGQAVYVTTNQYTFSGLFQYAKLRVFYKSQLYWVGTTGSLSWWDFFDTALLDSDGTHSFTVKPAQAGSSLTGEYLINTRTSGGSAITLWRLTNPLASGPTLTRQATVAIGSYLPGPNAPQLSGTDALDIGDCRTQEVWFQGGKLVTAFTESHDWGSGTVAAVRTLGLDAASSALELNIPFGSDGLWYVYPSIIRDPSGNLALVFSRSNSSEYANSRYTVKLVADSGWQGSATLKLGEGSYSKLFNSRNRWGDYSGAALDPADLTKAWVYAEYAATGNNWSTWIGQVPLGATSTNFTITTSSFPANGGTTSGGGTFAAGTSRTVMATANSGFVFSNWTENGSVASTSANYTFTLNSNRNLVANFQSFNAPPNDNFASAQLVSGASGSTSGSNVNATQEVDEPNHAGKIGGRSIWFKWVAPFSGRVTFDTFTSNFDTLLAVYTGTNVAILTPIASNDDAAGGTQSSVNFNAAAGVTYRIAVDGFGGATGNVVLHWLLSQQTFTVSISASPANGGVVAGGGTFPSGSNVTVTATPNSGFTFTNWTENGGVVSPSLSYSFTINANRTLVANFAVQTVNYTITTSASPSNGGTTTGAGTFAAGTSRTVTAIPNSGFTFVNWTENGNIVSASSNYTFTLNGNRTLIANFSGATTPPNDNFAASQLIVGGSGMASGSNVNATKEVGEPNPAGKIGGVSIWYKWIAPMSGPVTFDTFTSDFDTVLAVYTGNSVGSLTSIVSNDDGGGGFQSSVTFNAGANVTYQIAVDGFQGATGAVALHWLQSQQLNYTIQVFASPSTKGSAFGGGTYSNGTPLTVSAVPRRRAAFINWTENGTVVSLSPSYTFTVTGNRTLTANFGRRRR